MNRMSFHLIGLLILFYTHSLYASINSFVFNQSESIIATFVFFIASLLIKMFVFYKLLPLSFSKTIWMSITGYAAAELGTFIATAFSFLAGIPPIFMSPSIFLIYLLVFYVIACIIEIGVLSIIFNYRSSQLERPVLLSNIIIFALFIIYKSLFKN